MNIHFGNAVREEKTITILNLFNNAFYAAALKSQTADGTFEPSVLVTTRNREQNKHISKR